MNKNAILVRNINHLTDARYFAAMGVDWMSMELNEDPASFMRWHTLKDWVEGVKLAAEINPTDEMLLAKTIIDAAPEGIVLHSKAGTDIPSGIQLIFDAKSIDKSDIPPDTFLIVDYNPDLGPEEFLPLNPQTSFLQAEWTVDSLEILLQAGYTGGICFSGGKEEVTGMRDYGMMDDLFALLMS